MSMALLFTDGFEKGTATAPQPKWAVNAFTGSGVGRFGADTAWYCQASSASPEAALSSSAQGIHFGFGFKKVALGTGGIIFRLYENSTLHFSISIAEAGIMSVLRLAVELATSVSTIEPNSWVHIEGRVWLADASGRITIKVNGDTWIDFTGDTRNAGSGFINVVNLVNASNNSQCWYDDLYIYSITNFDTDPWIGDVRIFTLSPDGAGNYTQWTPNTGTNYANVDETTPDNETTYNYTTGTNYIDTFAFGNIVGAGTIVGVNHWLVARKDDAGARTINFVSRSAGVDSFGTGVGIGDTYGMYSWFTPNSPFTSGTWTMAEINDAEFGYRLDA